MEEASWVLLQHMGVTLTPRGKRHLKSRSYQMLMVSAMPVVSIDLDLYPRRRLKEELYCAILRC